MIEAGKGGQMSDGSGRGVRPSRFQIDSGLTRKSPASWAALRKALKLNLYQTSVPLASHERTRRALCLAMTRAFHSTNEHDVLYAWPQPVAVGPRVQHRHTLKYGNMHSDGCISHVFWPWTIHHEDMEMSAPQARVPHYLLKLRIQRLGRRLHLSFPSISTQVTRDWTGLDWPAVLAPVPQASRCCITLLLPAAQEPLEV